MKRQFFDYIIQLMNLNKDIYFISVGLGWPRTDQLKELFPDRFIQTEASEQTALDIAVGLSYSGKIPVVYTITSFYWRAAETIRTYLDHEKLPCILIGAGRDEEYGELDGFSHSATDIHELFTIFNNFIEYYPDTEEGMKKCIDTAIENREPSFINIRK